MDKKVPPPLQKRKFTYYLFNVSFLQQNLMFSYFNMILHAMYILFSQKNNIEHTHNTMSFTVFFVHQSTRLYLHLDLYKRVK